MPWEDKMSLSRFGTLKQVLYGHIYLAVWQTHQATHLVHKTHIIWINALSVYIKPYSRCCLRHKDTITFECASLTNSLTIHAGIGIFMEILNTKVAWWFWSDVAKVQPTVDTIAIVFYQFAYHKKMSLCPKYPCLPKDTKKTKQTNKQIQTNKQKTKYAYSCTIP